MSPKPYCGSLLLVGQTEKLFLDAPVACLLEHQGSIPIPNFVCVPDELGPIGTSFGGLAPIRDAEGGVLMLIEHFGSELPSGFIPFGLDGNGDAYLVKASKKETPVYFWLTETNELVLLATSFDEFFLRLLEWGTPKIQLGGDY